MNQFILKIFLIISTIRRKIILTIYTCLKKNVTSNQFLRLIISKYIVVCDINVHIIQISYLAITTNCKP